MTYQTRINYRYLLLGMLCILGFITFWITFLFSITAFYTQLHTAGATATKWISWLLWGFLFVMGGPLMLYGIARNTVILHLNEQGIQIQYPLLFKTKPYVWHEIESFSQTRRPVKSWIGRLLLWSKVNQYLTFYITEQEEVIINQSFIKDYKELPVQLACFPIANEGWEDETEKKSS